MEFVRWGGLSPVKQKGRFVPDKILNNPGDQDFGFFGTYHRPPVRNGVYAFIPEAIEMFLIAWKIYSKKPNDKGIYPLKKEFEHPRRFNYSGKIWTHIFINSPEITYYRRRDSWYETDTDSFQIILKKHKWELSKETTSGKKDEWCRSQCKDFADFVKTWKIYSKDHFEVFIERIK